MPQARSAGSGSSSGARSKRSSSSSGTKRSSSASRTSRASGSRAKTASSTASKPAAQARKTSGAADARLDAVAQRLRKLNERIIDAGREAGETTLTSYERALKAIATSIERGPGSSDVEWISHLATIQAKWIRDVTSAITSAARDAMK
jgi:hypothetical protein